MQNDYKFLKIFYLICLLLFSILAEAQNTTIADCDSLIKLGLEKLEKNKHTQSLELLFKARAIAKTNGWDYQEYLAANNIGTNYYRLTENGEALNYFLQAYNITVKKLATKDQLKVLNNIAIIYFEEKKYQQANDYFRKIYKSAKESNDSITAGVAAINMGTLAVENKEFELGKNYYKEAAVLLAKKPDNVILAMGGLAYCDLLQGHTEQARELAQSLLSKTKNPEYYNLEIELLMIISKSYLKENNLDTALMYANKVRDKDLNQTIKMQLFELLSEINSKNNRFDRALQFKDSLYEASNKLNEIKNKKIFENSKIKFELQNYKNQSEIDQVKLLNERRIVYYVLIFIVIGSLLVVWAARNASLKLKQKKLIAERNEKILALELGKERSESLLLEQQLKENKTLSLLEKEKLKNEVEKKNRTLSAKALYLSGRNEMIKEILSQLAILPQVSKDSTLLNQMKSLKNQLKSDKEWDHFITHFEEVNPGFLNELKTRHSTLTINDIRYLSYIFMNLSTKEIASMLNITQETCRKRKERILLKLELPKDTNLYNYLTSL